MKLLLLTLLPTAALSQIGPFSNLCSDDVKCQDVSANGLTFHCRVSGPSNGMGVILLHGFPEWSKFFIPLMRDWIKTQKPLRAVACDLRGYSPGALPDDHTQYTYFHFHEDVLSIADAFSFDKFHLVGHDHGSGLGWYLAKHAASRVLSYSAFSVPHPDMWSSAITTDVETQAKFNYANHWALVDSATKTVSGMTMFMMIGRDSFANAEWFQKALWWYTGTLGTTIAAPPVLSDALMAQYAPSWEQYVRAAIPLPEQPAIAQSEPVGAVSVPSLFVCGAKDQTVKCSGIDGLYEKGGSLITGPYTYLLVNCAHGVLEVKPGQACDNEAEVSKVIAAVNTLIESVKVPSGEQSTGSVTSSGRSGRVLIPYFHPALIILFVTGLFC